MSGERVLDREELATDVALEAVLGVDLLRVPRQGTRVAESLVAQRANLLLLVPVGLVHPLRWAEIELCILILQKVTLRI